MKEWGRREKREERGRENERGEKSLAWERMLREEKEM